MMETEVTEPSVAVHHVSSEVGRLRSVILHRPGLELSRLTPRNSQELLFDAVPWLEGAQREHDAFAQTLRKQDVEVLYITDLIAEALQRPQARFEAIDRAVGEPWLGSSLSNRVRGYLEELPPKELTTALIGGVRMDELATLAPVATPSLVTALADPHAFALAPLPNMLFTRDSSFWVGGRVAVSTLARRVRSREASLTHAVYAHHPRFEGTEQLYEPAQEPIEGGDVLVLGEGVIAVGTGERTTPAGVERLARHMFATGAAHTVLAVPILSERATMHLDTVCTMVDVDSMLVYPQVAAHLSAYTLTSDGNDGLLVEKPRSFLEAAADALGLERINIVDASIDPVTAEREQWDDAYNSLAVAPGMVVTYERNHVTNDRLRAAGVTVLEISGAQVGSGRGGPRCMSCPVLRDRVK